MPLPSFSCRATAPEWLDERTLPLDEFAQMLDDLEAANAFTRAAPPTLAFLDRLTAGWARGTVLRVADIGYGQGGMLRRIHRWADDRGFRPRLTGIDINPQCRVLALARTPPGFAIEWHHGNLFDWAPAEPPHVVVSALFAHHLPNPDVIRLLEWQEATATHGWFINDLHRHWFAWGGFSALAWTMRWHPWILHDGALSVRRAFVPADWRALLADAGITGASIRWHALFRLCVSRVKCAPGPA